MKRLRYIVTVLLALGLGVWQGAAAVAAAPELSPIKTLGQEKPFARASHQEALTMLRQAVDLVEQQGVQRAQRVFGDPAGAFHKKDLYVTVLTLSGRMVAHGRNPRLVGMELIDLKDIDGRPFIRQSMEIAKERGMGYVEYRWTDPLTKKLMPKRMYFMRVGDYTVNVGIYNPHNYAAP